MSMFSIANVQQLKAELLEMNTPTLRWGVVVIVAMLFWSMVYDPFLAWKDERLELLQYRTLEESKLNGLKQSADQWQKAKIMYQAALIKGTNAFFQQRAAISLGKVQKIIVGLAKKNKLKLLAQKSFDPVVQEDVGMRLPSSFTLRGHTDDIVRFLVDVASYPKVLVIDDLRVNRQFKGEAMLSLRMNGYTLENMND